jgi:hypothetical protein
MAALWTSDGRFKLHHDRSSGSPKNAKQETLCRIPGGRMVVPPRSHQFEAFAQFSDETRLIVSVDGQPAAFFRAVSRKRSDDDMTAGPDCLSHAGDIGRTVRRIRQKMEGCPIMPEIERPGRVPLGYVGDDPLHLTRAFAEPRPGGIERGRRDIQHCHAIEPTVEKAVNKARRTAANIDDGGFGRRPRKADQFKRRRGIFLEPANFVFALCRINAFPMGFPVRIFHKAAQDRRLDYIVWFRADAG